MWTGVAVAISLMSAPAAKARSLPVMTMRADAGVLVECFQSVHCLSHEFTVEGVEGFGSIELHDADAAVGLQQIHRTWDSPCLVVPTLFGMPVAALCAA